MCRCALRRYSSVVVVAMLAMPACGPDQVDESILPNGDTQLGALRGASVDTLCAWTRERLAEASDADCDLAAPEAASEYDHLVDFAGSSCGPEPAISTDCTLSVEDYDACVNAFVADACAAAPTELCAQLGKCALARVALGLRPDCSGLAECCATIEQTSERQRCQSVATGDSELACGLALAGYVGLCPNANDASKRP
jgi:hypothetical protein